MTTKKRGVVFKEILTLEEFCERVKNEAVSFEVGNVRMGDRLFLFVFRSRGDEAKIERLVENLKKFGKLDYNQKRSFAYYCSECGEVGSRIWELSKRKDGGDSVSIKIAYDSRCDHCKD